MIIRMSSVIPLGFFCFGSLNVRELKIGTQVRKAPVCMPILKGVVVQRLTLELADVTSSLLPGSANLFYVH